MASAGCSMRTGRAVDRDRAGVPPLGAEDEAGGFGAAGADQPAMPTISPARTEKEDPADEPRPGEPFDPEHLRPRLHPDAGELLIDPPADQSRTSSRVGVVRGVDRGHVQAVAEDRDPIGDLGQFLQRWEQ
jgi:hypothetical protein